MRYRSIAQVYEFQGFSQSRCTSCVQEPLYQRKSKLLDIFFGVKACKHCCARVSGLLDFLFRIVRSEEPLIPLTLFGFSNHLSVNFWS